MGKLDRIKKVVKKINDRAGSEVIGIGTSMLQQGELIQTPFPTVNALIGGFPRGRFSTLAGPERTGKGTLLLQTIAWNMRQDKNFIVVWVDAENALDLAWVEKMGVDPARFIILRYPIKKEDAPDDSLSSPMEDLLQRSIDSTVELDADMKVVDSIGGLLPAAEARKDIKENTMLDLQRKMGAYYRKANVLLPKTTAIVLVGQVYAVPTTTGVGLEAVKGGNAVKHWASLRVMTRRTGKSDAPEKETETQMPDGTKRKVLPAWNCRITVEKTRINSNEGKAIHLPFYYGEGFSREISTMKAGVALGIIQKAGGHFIWGEQKWHGKDALVAHFKTTRADVETLAKQIEERK